VKRIDDKIEDVVEKGKTFIKNEINETLDALDKAE